MDLRPTVPVLFTRATFHLREVVRIEHALLGRMLGAAKLGCQIGAPT